MSDSSAREVTGGYPEPQPVRQLRSFTSFQAPELGATLDTSTLAILMRNLLVNWAMLIPVLFAAVAAERSSAFLLQEATGWFQLQACAELLDQVASSSNGMLDLLPAASALVAAFPGDQARQDISPPLIRAGKIEPKTESPS